MRRFCQRLLLLRSRFLGCWDFLASLKKMNTCFNAAYRWNALEGIETGVHFFYRLPIEQSIPSKELTTQTHIKQRSILNSHPANCPPLSKLNGPSKLPTSKNLYNKRPLIFKILIRLTNPLKAAKYRNV